MCDFSREEAEVEKNHEMTEEMRAGEIRKEKWREAFNKFNELYEGKEVMDEDLEKMADLYVNEYWNDNYHDIEDWEMDEEELKDWYKEATGKDL